MFVPVFFGTTLRNSKEREDSLICSSPKEVNKYNFDTRFSAAYLRHSLKHLLETSLKFTSYQILSKIVGNTNLYSLLELGWDKDSWLLKEIRVSGTNPQFVANRITKFLPKLKTPTIRKRLLIDLVGFKGELSQQLYDSIRSLSEVPLLCEMFLDFTSTRIDSKLCEAIVDVLKAQVGLTEISLVSEW
eukprot:TRINITY_DN10698_c0_g1_i1.p1 TRINITY_DN10698_c0_g1~~TRINITY_DN10698_c0_g1_i1.p1  ORF type:complete len:188 (+),score=21.02 TRINITY_DN10698_c0_g1_i1:457-1020(+)